jgi:hypothetical protein
MNTDVGFSRMLYYYGIVGSFCFFMPFFFILSYLVRKNNDMDCKYMLYSFAASLIFCNIKGFVDINWMMFLLFAVCINNKISTPT